ncbi:MAG: M56 family metallopeptidase [Blastomonas sp.]
MIDWLPGASLSDPAAQWLFDTLLATSLLMALVLMLRRPVAHFFGPQIAYLLWAVPFARLFLPPVTRIIEVPAAPSGEPVMAMPVVADPQWVSGGAEIAAAPASVSIDWLMIALVAWLGGALLFLLSHLAAYAQNRRELLADAVPLGRHGNSELVEIAGISGPFAFGLIRRYIALPIGFDRQYDPVERELALAHESAHHRRGDLWANFAGLGMLSLHWFNPIAWHAWRAFRFDQEAACDAGVIRACNAPERAAYARAIAKAATGQMLVFASPLNPKEKIVERLKIMKTRDRSNTRKWLGGGMIGVALVSALGLTATVTYALQPVEPAEPPAVAAVPLPPSAVAEVPEVPAVPAVPEISWEDGRHVVRIERDGKKMILKSDKEMSQDEIDRMVRKFDDQDGKFDLEFDGDVRAFARSSADDGKDSDGKVRKHRRVQIVGPDGHNSLMHEGKHGEWDFEFGDGSGKIKFEDCTKAGANASFVTKDEIRDGKTVTTRLVSCDEAFPDKLKILEFTEKGLADAFKHLEGTRILVGKDFAFSERAQAEARAELEREMENLRKELDEVRRELKQLRKERARTTS